MANAAEVSLRSELCKVPMLELSIASKEGRLQRWGKAYESRVNDQELLD